MQLFLKPNFPVLPSPDLDAGAVLDALKGEKYTWAIVQEVPGSRAIPVVMSAAIVEPSFTDDEFDALDNAISSFRVYLGDDGEPEFVVNGDKVAPDDARMRIFRAVLHTSGISNAAGIRVILSNGPRWVLIGTAAGVTISRSQGERADGSSIDTEPSERVKTGMYGGLVSLAFEEVITRDAKNRLQAAKAAASAS